MDTKDVLTIVAPIGALLVAIATIAFNAYDRRRSFAIEREKLKIERKKLSQEIARALLANSRSFEKRSDVYNTVLSLISSISNVFHSVEVELKTSTSPSWSHLRVVALSDEVQSTLQTNQIFTTRYIHETIIRRYLLEICRYSEEVDDALNTQPNEKARVDAVLNLTTQAIAASDAAKSAIREDLESFVRNLSREAMDIHEDRVE